MNPLKSQIVVPLTSHVNLYLLSILICQQMGANKLFVNMRRDVRALTTFLKIRQKLPIQSGTGEEKFSEVSDENEHDG